VYKGFEVIVRLTPAHHF